MNYKKTISYVLTLVLLLLSSTACSRDNTIKEITDNNIEEVIEYEPTQGGEIVVPLTNLNTLNPLMTENISYYHFGKLIFESIFELDEDLNVIPQLAEDYSIVNEGRTISIKLKKGVKWHDGEEFNANDVAFTINTLKYAKDTSSFNNMFLGSQGFFGKDGIEIITDVVVIDRYNINVNFKEAFGNNLELLTFPIIAEHIFADAKIPFAKALEIENYIPIGTGPYKYVSYEKLKNISLISNEDYRDGQAYITNVDGKVLEDENLILTAFETGQLSIATSIGVDWDKYKSNKRIRTVEFVSNNYEFIGFNFEKEIFQGESGLAIREAINYGIDRQAIISKIYLGHAYGVNVPIHPESWLVPEDGNNYAYNIEKAKEILNNVGWKDLNEDGILEDENGDKLSLRIITNTYNHLRFNTTEMIVEDLKKIGIDIIKDYDIKYMESSTEEQITTEWEDVNIALTNGDFDMAVLGWEMSFIPELSSIFHSSDNLETINFVRYKNETMDELLLSVYGSWKREDKKINYNKLQKFIEKDIPYVSLFYKNKAILVDSKIIGDLNPMFLNPYNGLKDCFIPENLQ